MRRRPTPPVQERKPPFYVGIDIGKAMHHAYVMDAEGTPCVPEVLAFANTHAGYSQLCTTLTEAMAQAEPTKVTVGCEATGPDWLSLYEALMAQGYNVLVLNPFYVKARRGTTLRGTKTDPLDARLITAILPREHGPISHVPEATVQGLRDLTRVRAELVGQIGDVKRRIIGRPAWSSICARSLA
jgi:transposase